MNVMFTLNLTFLKQPGMGIAKTFLLNRNEIYNKTPFRLFKIRIFSTYNKSAANNFEKSIDKKMENGSIIIE